MFDQIALIAQDNIFQILFIIAFIIFSFIWELNLYLENKKEAVSEYTFCEYLELYAKQMKGTEKEKIVDKLKSQYERLCLTIFCIVLIHFFLFVTFVSVQNIIGIVVFFWWFFVSLKLLINLLKGKLTVKTANYYTDYFNS